MTHSYKIRFILWFIVIILVIGACNTSPPITREQALAEGRSYSGAPPVIGHQVLELGRAECLSCHLHGDSMDKQGRKSTPTPHPELSRCTQCHVESKTKNLFVKNQFKGKPYAMGIRSQPNGPWLIPHPLTMRENCLGCHGTEAAPTLMKTTHPERQRCIQCHIPAHKNFPGPRQKLKENSETTFKIWKWSL